MDNEKLKEKVREVFLFPIDARNMIEGEKNKVIKIFLNQLDLKIDDDKTRQELRQIFLDSINGFARFSKGLLKNYSNNAQFFERLIDAVSCNKENS